MKYSYFVYFLLLVILFPFILIIWTVFDHKLSQSPSSYNVRIDQCNQYCNSLIRDIPVSCFNFEGAFIPNALHTCSN